MVDYNDFAKTFSQSRKNMKWEEITYFLTSPLTPLLKGEGDKEVSILDIWCGNGRFLWALLRLPSPQGEGIQGWGYSYLWIDLSAWLLEEARKLHPEYDFQKLNMTNIDKLEWKFDYIFFIASFHHLQTIEEREAVLKKAYNLLKDWGQIFMTNWALNSPMNHEKYQSSLFENSQNEFWSTDYNIKIWKFYRYYHCFNLSELEYLAHQSWLKVIENRIFDTEKNFISIFKK